MATDLREIQGRLQQKASLEKQRDEYRADLGKIDAELKVLVVKIYLLSPRFCAQIVLPRSLWRMAYSCIRTGEVGWWLVFITLMPRCCHILYARQTIDTAAKPLDDEIFELENAKRKFLTKFQRLLDDERSTLSALRGGISVLSGNLAEVHRCVAHPPTLSLLEDQ